MKLARIVLQGLYYSLVFAFLLSRAVSSGISHDENQFIAAGQLLAHHGLLPYLDFPYTHMPYAVFIYALSARVSSYDYLSARILGAIAWMACIVLIIAISRLVRRSHGISEQGPWSIALLFGEFATVLIFLYHPISSYVLGAALNHSFATFFTLLSLLFFLRVLRGQSSFRRGAFLSALFISLAACTRLNFASLVIVMAVVFLAYDYFSEGHPRLKVLLPFGAGLLVAALPALVMFLLDPAGFYFANLVFIRLNTLYYGVIKFRQNMNLAAKALSFQSSLWHSPVDLVLYGILLILGIVFFVRALRNKSLDSLTGLSAAATAGTLFLTAFSPTPTQWHYFFAPLPFMLLVTAILGFEIYRRARPAYLLFYGVLLLTLYLTTRLPNPLVELPRLLDTAAWRPLQVHEFAESLKPYVPEGRILSLQPMITLEAGYDAYPFTATGPFAWRTSLLLSASRRAEYGVTSPEELPKLLDASPPGGILTGFEAPNAGFELGDLGGLETPFIEYAEQHDYTPIPLTPRFLQHTIILWVRPH